MGHLEYLNSLRGKKLVLYLVSNIIDIEAMRKYHVGKPFLYNRAIILSFTTPMP